MSCVHKKKGQKRGRLHAIRPNGKDTSKAKRIEGTTWGRKAPKAAAQGSEENRTAAEHKPALVSCLTKDIGDRLDDPLLSGSRSEQGASPAYHPATDRVLWERIKLLAAAGVFPSREA
ncbi:hypothetical protein A7K93_04390 [Candidatus Methylacidiphilum fumarolicum]|nr:hypothetical protein A7K73_04685 [Candidatus Methylacidiphilum fumarolicum]TFE74257.1 hypothetical protein A7K93_04390 [Candidatus Methylacidiphilum fumarolicum]TFE75756.1 hypothetical protein A7K72_01070 [Candidatus Methylacidiphilum fumarolicum]TFE75915.1 hypothetical protein A7D33_01275 [Candidatus Methylacidiphilum fumarolicum]